jgi:hypothetical protein
MDQISFLNNLVFHTNNIDLGRKGLAADGREHDGRITYEGGISGVSAAFLEAHISTDPQIIILGESAFLQQELQFCHKTDMETQSSLIQAIQSFKDALRCLETVVDFSTYASVEKAFPTTSKYRIQGFPKDAVHLASIAHRTRLHNVLRSPGINIIEKAVLTQRIANMTTVQKSYITMQKNALNA